MNAFRITGPLWGESIFSLCCRCLGLYVTINHLSRHCPSGMHTEDIQEVGNGRTSTRVRYLLPRCTTGPLAGDEPAGCPGA